MAGERMTVAAGSMGEVAGWATPADCTKSYIHTALRFHVSTETQAQHSVIGADPQRRRQWTSRSSAALVRCVTATCALSCISPPRATPVYVLPSASCLSQDHFHMPVL